MKKVKEKLKYSRKGITLISLIVTIIVLIILAGISIAMLVGDSSIIKQSTNANMKTSHTSVLEAVQLNISDYVVQKNTKKTNSTLIDYLQSKSIIGDEIGTNSGKYQINVSALGISIKYGTGIATESEKNDVYMLEKVDTSISILPNVKIASTTSLIMATTPNDETTYKVVYYGETSEILEVGDIVADSGESQVANLITFTIEGIEYQAEEGMTWRIWATEYKSDEFFVRGNFVSKYTGR